LSTYQEWTNKKHFKTPIRYPCDIWKAKQIEGDKADNLVPGSPIEVIDLLTPPTEFDLLQTEHKDTLSSVFDFEHPNTEEGDIRKAHTWILKQGLSFPGCGANFHPVLKNT
jgi:hypothetical protein